jgi:hypothetical protein
MIQILLLLQPGEAKALRAMCRRFTFDDALHHLHGVNNIAPDALIEGISRLREALDAAGDSPSTS